MNSLLYISAGCDRTGYVTQDANGTVVRPDEYRYGKFIYRVDLQTKKFHAFPVGANLGIIQWAQTGAGEGGELFAYAHATAGSTNWSVAKVLLNPGGKATVRKLSTNAHRAAYQNGFATYSIDVPQGVFIIEGVYSGGGTPFLHVFSLVDGAEQERITVAEVDDGSNPPASTPFSTPHYATLGALGSAPVCVCCKNSTAATNATRHLSQKQSTTERRAKQLPILDESRVEECSPSSK